MILTKNVSPGKTSLFKAEPNPNGSIKLSYKVQAPQTIVKFQKPRTLGELQKRMLKVNKKLGLNLGGQSTVKCTRTNLHKILLSNKSDAEKLNIIKKMCKLH